MVRMFLAGFWIALVFAAPSARAADDDKGNCKLVIQTRYASGKKKLEISVVEAESRDDCKAQAHVRELDTTEEGVESRKARFGWRIPK